MNISLEDYSTFAKQINFEATKIDGVFCYKHKNSHLILNPFQLGELYRDYQRMRLLGIEEVLSKLQYVCKDSQRRKTNLAEDIRDFLKDEQTYLQSQHNKLK